MLLKKHKIYCQNPLKFINDSGKKKKKRKVFIRPKKKKKKKKKVFLRPKKKKKKKNLNLEREEEQQVTFALRAFLKERKLGGVYRLYRYECFLPDSLFCLLFI